MKTRIGAFSVFEAEPLKTLSLNTSRYREFISVL
jgi:hypothetical protein